MKAYDPNSYWSTHTVEITFQQWDYTATETVTVRGTCMGYSILRSALQNHAADLYERHGDAAEMILKRPALDGSGEDELACSPDEEGINSLETWLEEMCVGMKIVDFHSDFADQP